MIGFKFVLDNSIFYL
jgi:hypothetical protein